MIYSTADVKALFDKYGKPIATFLPDGTVLETEEERLTRLAMQLTSGLRTIEEVEAAIAASGEIDPDAPLEYGGVGARELQTQTGTNGQIWLDSSTGTWYMAFTWPDSDVWVAFDATEAELKGELGLQGDALKPDRTLMAGDLDRLGVIEAGNFADVDMQQPFRHLIESYEAELEIAPWIADPDWVALQLEAWIEGRDITDAELMSTAWFKNHSDAQREWMILYNSDPASAAQRLDSNIISIRQTLQSMGSANPPESVVTFMATQATQGTWSQAKLQEQLLAISDPASGITVDPALQAALGTQDLDTTQNFETEVRDLAAKWLGPQFGNWTDTQIQHWAGRFRNDPDAETQLVEILRQQRMALFPEYTNSQLTYEDIASPWRQVYAQVWGQAPQEDDAFFYDIVRANDAVTARSMLTKEGLKRGIEKVEQDFLTGMLSSTGDTVRRAF